VGSIRRAKTKLPKEIQKKIDEWSFASGALVLCLVAYPDGQEVRSFQFVPKFNFNWSFLNYFIEGRVPQFQGMPSRFLRMTGRMAPTKISKNGR
jgi:hypothetical protein